MVFFVMVRGVDYFPGLIILCFNEGRIVKRFDVCGFVKNIHYILK